jgi:hypothetical protein
VISSLLPLTQRDMTIITIILIIYSEGSVLKIRNENVD